MAAIPRRPVWRDSDPRWRRHMLAGAWIISLLPLMSAMQAFEWASNLPVPTIFDYRGTVRTLNDTLICYWDVYDQLVFCIGIVLLFSKERRRRRGPLDWTRRWGVICSYVVFLLNAAQFLFIPALILAGIAALFLSMPLKYQPAVTRFFVEVSATYLRYGPYPKDISAVVLAAFSSITILLACIPLFDALRSSGPKRTAWFLLAPLALFSLMHLTLAGLYWLKIPGVTSTDVYSLAVYFRPRLLFGQTFNMGISGYGIMSGAVPMAIGIEAVKWCIVLAIAAWLTIAQLAARRQPKRRAPYPDAMDRLGGYDLRESKVGLVPAPATNVVSLYLATDAAEPSRSEYVRTQRRHLAFGIWIPFAFGIITFCLVAPVLALLNVVVPYLPWIPKDRPITPAIETAWFCARFFTGLMLVLWLILFVFVPKIPRRPRNEV